MILTSLNLLISKSNCLKVGCKKKKEMKKAKNMKKSRILHNKSRIRILKTSKYNRINTNLTTVLIKTQITLTASSMWQSIPSKRK